jgi:sec-independent protein translocase protein TatC
MSTVASTLVVTRPPGWRENARRVRAFAVDAFLGCAALLSEMPFLDHLEELRRRLLRSIIAIAVALILCLSYAAELIDILRLPADRAGLPLIAVEGTEIFSLYFRAAFVCAVCIAAPFVLWQVWRFIAPGLHRHEKRYAGPFLVSTTVAFIAGAVFGYFVLFPLTLSLILSMADPVHIKVQMSAMSYFDLLSLIVISMGVVFEIPPVIFVLSRIGLVSGRFLARNFKYAFLLSFTAAAVLTPSTTMTPMIMVALPMVVLYAVGIAVAYLFGRPRQEEA